MTCSLEKLFKQQTKEQIIFEKRQKRT